MKIYLASFFDTRERLRPHRDKLWSLGHEVVSSWLDEIAKPKDMDMDTFYKKLAIKDLAEIKACDLLILDTFDLTPRGGREVEFGFALGQHQSKFLYMVGPARNVFHQLADHHFASWEDCLYYLEKNHAIHPTPGEIVTG